MKYLGPVYQIAAYGDTLKAWVTPDQAQAFASIGIHDQERGNNAARLAKARWIAASAVEGGPERLADHVSRHLGQRPREQAILYFMLFDPAAPLPARSAARAAAHVRRPAARAASSRAPAGAPTRRCSTTSAAATRSGTSSATATSSSSSARASGSSRSGSGTPTTSASSRPTTTNTLAVQNARHLRRRQAAGPPVVRGDDVEAGRPVHARAERGRSDGRDRASGAAGRTRTATRRDLYNRPRPTPDASAVDVTHASRSIAWIAARPRGRLRPRRRPARPASSSGGTSRSSTSPTSRAELATVDDAPRAAALRADAARARGRDHDGHARGEFQPGGRRRSDALPPHGGGSGEPARRALPPRDPGRRRGRAARRPSSGPEQRGTPFEGAAVGAGGGDVPGRSGGAVHAA